MFRLLRVLALMVLVVAVASPAVAGDNLFLWKIEGEHATVHLTGSIHVGRSEFYPLPEAIGSAFVGADVLAVEVDISDPEVMQKAAQITMTKGMLPGEATLESSLDPELYARLVAYAAERDINLAMYGKFRPSIVAMALIMEEYERQGFQASLGIDTYFLDAAGKLGKEIRQLESIEVQMALFLDMSDRLDDLLLAEVMDQSEELMELTEKMVVAWQAGDAAALDALLQDQMGDDPEMEEFYRKLLDNRNVAIVDIIDFWLQGKEDIFVVVGAGHFGGEMGMLNLLAKRGWTVTQITE